MAAKVHPPREGEGRLRPAMRSIVRSEGGGVAICSSAAHSTTPTPPRPRLSNRPRPPPPRFACTMRADPPPPGEGKEGVRAIALRPVGWRAADLPDDSIGDRRRIW